MRNAALFHKKIGRISVQVVCARADGRARLLVYADSFGQSRVRSYVFSFVLATFPLATSEVQAINKYMYTCVLTRPPSSMNYLSASAHLAPPSEIE